MEVDGDVDGDTDMDSDSGFGVLKNRVNHIPANMTITSGASHNIYVLP